MICQNGCPCPPCGSIPEGLSHRLRRAYIRTYIVEFAGGATLLAGIILLILIRTDIDSLKYSETLRKASYYALGIGPTVILLNYTYYHCYIQPLIRQQSTRRMSNRVSPSTVSDFTVESVTSENASTISNGIIALPVPEPSINVIKPHPPPPAYSQQPPPPYDDTCPPYPGTSSRYPLDVIQPNLTDDQYITLSPPLYSMSEESLNEQVNRSHPERPDA